MSQQTQIEELIIINVFEQIKRKIKQGIVDLDDYMSIVMNVMQIVESYRSLSGADKKVVVIKVVLDLVGEANIEIMKQILTRTTISNLIEVIIKVAKGEIDFKKKVKGCKNKLTSCCRK